jgi:hypothetical protein
VSDMELFPACQAEAKELPINLGVVDPSPFMPPPMGIRSVLKMSDLKVREVIIGSEFTRKKLRLSLMPKPLLWTNLRMEHLTAEFVPSVEDCSKDEETAKT